MNKRIYTNISLILAQKKIFAFKKKVSKLFDSVFYLNVHKDIAEAGVNSYYHYIHDGWKERRSPSFLFDAQFYVKKYKIDSTIDPVQHYLDNYYTRELNPHPLFDAKFYLANVKEPLPKGISPLEHFYTIGIEQKIAPHPDFSFNDIELYKKGLRELKKGEQFGYDFYSALSLLDKDMPTFLCMTHEASRTGAPLIILKIGEYLKRDFNFQIINFIGFGGDITTDFQKVGPSILFQHWHPDGRASALYEIEYVLNKIKEKDINVIGAYVNSAESRNAISTIRDNLEIPVYTLIHEMAYLYPPSTYQVVADHSSKVIFPSQIVKEYALENADFSSNKIIVRGQGLLKPEMLQLNKKKARKKLLEELNLPSNAFIVLGCGSINRRKAPELFCQTACNLLKRKNTKHIYFIWLGGAHDFSNDDFYWTFKDIEKLGLDDRIIFLGQKTETAHYFCGSDLFYLTSRADPFPCVIHEAMAAELPIVAYENAGGFSEAIAEGAGILVGYTMTNEAADVIEELEKNRKKASSLGFKAKQRLLKEYMYYDYVEFLLKDLLISNYSDARLKELNIVIPEIKRNHKGKIVFTLPAWGVSGVNTFVEHLVARLVEENYDAEILFTTNHHLRLEEVYMPKVPYKFLGTNHGDNRLIWKRLEQYLCENSPCVFVPSYDYIASAICPKLPSSIGILGVLHSDDMEHYEHAYRLGHYWDKIVNVSNTIEQKLLDYNLSFKDKSSVIYYGIEHEKNKNISEKNDIFTIVYTGRIEQFQKNIFHYKEVITTLKRKTDQPFKFKFIGDGEDFEDFKDLMKVYVEEGLVDVLGRMAREDIYKELSKAHVFSLISNFEGLPLSLLEAMSNYCIPVLTDIKSGVGEIIQHEKNGMIAPIGDYEAYTDNIVYLMKNKEVQLQLAQNAYSTIGIKGLSKETMGDKYLEVIEDIFAICKAGKVERPPVLTFNPRIENILIPPILQQTV